MNIHPTRIQLPSMTSLSTRLLAPFAAVTLLVGSPAHATNYFWDADGEGGGTGGTGNWNTTEALWRNGSASGTLETWPTSGTHTATLQGTAGTLTLQDGVTINGTGTTISFATTTGYLIQSVGSGAFSIGATASMSLSASPGSVTGTISATINGVSGGNVIKSGAGTVVLSGANTYSRNTNISAGFLSVSSLNRVVGGTASSNLGAPTTVAFGTINLGTTASSAGTLVYTGAGESTDRVINLNGTTQGGGLQADGSGALVFESDFTATGSGAKTLTLSGSSTASNTIQGNIVDSAGGATALTKTGTGTWIVSGNKSYTGKTAIQNGTLSVNSLKNAGTSSSLGAATGGNATIDIGLTTLSAGTLRYTGAGDTTDRVINLAGQTQGATIDASGSGALVFTSSFTATGAGIKTLTLQGTNTGNNEILGEIVNNSAGNRTAVTKSGAGRWILSGTNSYTGNTTIDSGTLLVNGSLASGSSVTVNNGGILGGTGTVGGAITVAAGGRLAPGAGIESLDGSSVTWNSDDAAAWLWELSNTDNTADLLNLSGAFAKGTGSSFLFDFGGTGLAGQTYTLVTFASTTFASAIDFGLPVNLGSGLTGSYQLNANSLQLTVDAIPEPSAWAMMLGGLGLLGLWQRSRGGRKNTR